MTKPFPATILVAAFLATPLDGGQVSAPDPTVLPAESPCDELWKYATLYHNKENPVLQEFALQGRFQAQYSTGDSDQGDFSSGDLEDGQVWSDIDVRRFYAGFKAGLFQNLKINAQAIVNPDWGPVYGGIYEAYATWAVNGQCQIGAGKAEVKFGKEYEVSSKEIPTIERSLLTNQIAGGMLTGAWVNGQNVAGPWFYEVGLYAADNQPEFTEFRGGGIVLAKLGCDLKSMTGLDQSSIALHWMHNTEPGEAGAKPYDDCFALAGEARDANWAVTWDLLHASGEGVADAYGFTVIPTYNLTDKLQLVARYQIAHASGNDGLHLLTRYERLAPDLTDDGLGDAFQAGYLGLNYFICGHKLKLMTGFEYAHMHGESDGGDYDGRTWTSGLRFYF